MRSFGGGYTYQLTPSRDAYVAVRGAHPHFQSPSALVDAYHRRHGHVLDTFPNNNVHEQPAIAELVYTVYITGTHSSLAQEPATMLSDFLGPSLFFNTAG